MKRKKTSPNLTVVDSVRRWLRQLLDRTPGWKSPHRWSDAGGLYATDTDACLYRELPAAVLRPDASGSIPLDGVLRDMTAALGPGRDVHLLMHAWEELAEVPTANSPELAEYQAGALTFFVPTRRILIGVRLMKSADARAREARLRQATVASLDTLLGEYVPDFSAWDADRAAVDGVLERVGATIPASATEAHLEAWYTLGSRTDVDADERDDVITLGETSIVEMVAVAALEAGAGEPVPLMSAGRRGATVVSVRGQLTGGSGQRGLREDSTGTLSKTSIILGRRGERVTVPWAVTLRRFAGLEQRPLPMRQLQGLDETLPCSTRRLAPTLNRVNAAALSRAGFADTQRVGDDAGVFVGLASPDFSYPFFLDVSQARRPVTLVTGGEKSGKTFLAESAALQSSLDGRRVIYLTTTGDAGAALRELAGAVDLPVNEPGIFDPFRLMPAAGAAPLAAAMVARLVPDLTAAERSDLEAGFRRAASVGGASFERALTFADGVTGVAKLRRAASRSPYVAACISTAGAAPIVLPTVTVVDLGWYLPMDGEVAGGHDAELVTATVDAAVATLLLAAYAQPTPKGTLVVLDGAASVLDGPLTLAALEQLSKAPHVVHVLAVTSHTTSAARSPLLRHTEAVMALAETDREAADAALQLAGSEPDDARRAWLATAAASVQGEVVMRPALGLLRDRAGRRASFLVGPAAPAALPALTRGAAARYVASGS